MRYVDLLLDEAKIASVRFTFNDWSREHPTWSTLQAKCCLETNEKYTALVRPRETDDEEKWKERGWWPSLAFHWKTIVDAGLWPCAESEAMEDFHDLL
jgi:hypothetical protein